jgi:hypothetical protein
MSPASRRCSGRLTAWCHSAAVLFGLVIIDLRPAQQITVQIDGAQSHRSAAGTAEPCVGGGRWCSAGGWTTLRACRGCAAPADGQIRMVRVSEALRLTEKTIADANSQLALPTWSWCRAGIAAGC